MQANNRTEAQPVRYGAVRVLKGGHADKIGYDDDKGDKTVVYCAEPLSSGYVLIRNGWRL